MLDIRNFLKNSTLLASGFLLSDTDSFTFTKANKRNFVLCVNTQTLNNYPFFIPHTNQHLIGPIVRRRLFIYF